MLKKRLHRITGGARDHHPSPSIVSQTISAMMFGAGFTRQISFVALLTGPCQELTFGTGLFYFLNFLMVMKRTIQGSNLKKRPLAQINFFPWGEGGLEILIKSFEDFVSWSLVSVEDRVRQRWRGQSKPVEAVPHWMYSSLVQTLAKIFLNSHFDWF